MVKYLSILSAFALLLFAASCGDDKGTDPDPDPNPIDSTQKDSAHAEFMFFNGAPAAPAVNIGADASEVITDRSFSIIYDGYTRVDSGTHAITATPTGGTDILTTETFSFAKDEHYTLFLVNDTVGNFSFLRFHDDLTAPGAGKALVRIAHLIPDGPTVKMAIPASGLGAIFTNVKFMDNTELFTPLTAGSVRFRVQTIGSGGGGGGGDGTPVFSDVPVTLEEGKIYTFALVGRVADNSATGVLIEHKHD